MADGKSLKTIQTTSIIPVDLNALLYGLETAIAQGCADLTDAPCVAEFSGRAKARQGGDGRLSGTPRAASILDYQWRDRARLDHPSRRDPVSAVRGRREPGPGQGRGGGDTRPASPQAACAPPP